MAVTVERVHLAMAHAALPGLLPTPPAWKMAPLLPTPPCLIILPTSPPKPSPADAVDRWDAYKKNTISKPSSKATISRADAVDRWDACKITAAETSIAASSSSGSSSSHHSSSPENAKKKGSSSASSCARWDSNKKTSSPSSSSSSTSSSRSSSPVNRAALMSQRWDMNKRPPVSRGSSSSGRWDAHKKPRQPQTVEVDVDDCESSTGSNDMEVDDKPEPKLMGLYAGPGFIAPPEPSMLPVPSSFLLLPRFVTA